MATDCITQVAFQGDGFPKPVVARFDLPDASADGGLVLFKALDTELRLTRRLAACLEDARAPGKVLHETVELHVLAYTVIAQQRRRLRGRAPRIIIDLDPTDDPTHGQQEFAFFNGHRDKSRRSASAWSSSPCGSSVRPGASCCICR
jgi:hypothetical protein